MERTSSENIAEALKLLDEAASQKKDELRKVMSDKYTHLRGLIVENDNSLLKSLTTAKEHALQAAAHAKDVSVQKAREIACTVDKSVHENPWPYIAGTAAAGVLVGYILGRNRK